MSDTCRQGDQHLLARRQETLSPLARAIDRVEREQREVAAEREAFLAFADRVAGIEARRGRTAPQAVRSLERGTDGVARVREAYAETVMAVDHYDREYGEPLFENMGNELGADVAAVLAPSAGSQFTTVLKETVVGAAHRCAASREELMGRLEDELDSLRTTRDRLADLFDGGGHGEGVSGQLDTLAATRQDLIHRRDPVSAIDGHELCEYLYGDQPWTYPVLTALGRARGELPR